MSRLRPILRFVVPACALAATAVRLPAQISVLSSTVEERVATPGGGYSGRIAIQNTGTTAETVRLYQTDYRFSADGTSNFDAAGKQTRSNAAWISLQSPQVTVLPGTTVSVPYSVSVPASDSLRGTFWSVIMVEGATKPPTVAAAGHGKVEVGMGTVIRYAVQVATHIGETGSRGVKFTKAGVVRADTSAAIELDVDDVGERAYRPVMRVELYDAAGTLRAQARQARGLLYPGSSLRQHFDFGKLPAGTYKAVIFADTGEDTVYASQYTIVF
jgi:hypothetical protein